MAVKAKEYTVSGLAVELKMDRRKMASLVEDLEPHRKKGKVGYYWLRDVFDHLMMKGDEKLDAQQEQAKLNQARREKVELENQEFRGELCRTSDIEQYWADMLANCKTRLRGIPHHTAHRVMAASALSEALKILEDAIDESLHELAASGIPARQARAGSSEVSNSAS